MQKLDSEIQRRFIGRIERDEPAEAVYLAYRDRIDQLTDTIGDEFGVSIRRTGFRVRDRTNVADDWEFEKLEALQFSLDAGLSPSTLSFAEVVRNEAGEKMFRWIKPIVADEACLACHGENVETKVLDLINLDYPDDEATGYFQYELIGAYSISRIVD